MKLTLIAAAAVLSATTALAEAEKFTVDASHSQVAFSYNHAGFSTTHGLVSGFEGEVMFDQDDPAASSVSVSIGADRLFTGWQARDDHFLKSGDFFKLAEFPLVTFTSTGIEVTGEDTALITGDLTLNGVTKPVVLDTVLTGVVDEYPFPPFNGKKAIGFNATGSVMRSDFDLGLYAPFVGDEIALDISIEAMKLD
jgi:polyisoprenoid-binding protein YceI